MNIISITAISYFFTLKNGQDAVPKKKPSKSLYAKATDTGIDPELAAKKLNIDWDSAAEIEETNADDETEVPSVVVSS